MRIEKPGGERCEYPLNCGPAGEEGRGRDRVPNLQKKKERRGKAPYNIPGSGFQIL